MPDPIFSDLEVFVPLKKTEDYPVIVILENADGATRES